LPRARILLIVVVSLPLLLTTGCLRGGCDHGSWGDKYGWRCHDDNDERGPQRDIPPEH
jgi:hypothetical protein